MVHLVRPCHNLPGHRVYHIHIQAVDREQPRIEQAFRKYFYRATTRSCTQSTPSKKEQLSDKDQIEIIVGHPNVLRYFLCRSLQLPPETYGRYSLRECSITYVTIYPNGVVSCRTVGDIGHLSSSNVPDTKERSLW